MSVVDEVQRRRDNRNGNEGPTRSQESEKGDKIDTKTEADSVEDFSYSVISSLSFLRRDIVSSGLGIWLLMPKIGGQFRTNPDMSSVPLHNESGPKVPN